MNHLLHNPLLPGFYPDPSVCRKGDDYYMVTSSFEFFPGIPIFHSRDFVHWHQIGHVLTRPSQLNLDHVKPSKGIYAATIRYCEKNQRFYVITTLVQDPPYWGNLNFYVSSEHPEGPWSDPVVISGAEGIDPTLFFDEDRVYYLGNRRPHPEIPELEDRHIWLQEIDLGKGELIGERWTLLTDGALHHAVAPEGPHMYKKDGWYYLLIAEGGTDHNHSSTIFRSRRPEGPYECNPRNPVLTHRHLPKSFPIHSTGHSDLIQLANGEWWAVLLASRPDGGDYRNLGRETFAVPVIWEEGWPLYSPDTGKVEFSYPAPRLTPKPWPEPPACDQFEENNLDYCWQLLRTPRHPIYSLNARPGFLRLYLNEDTLSGTGNPAFVGRRQQHIYFQARTVMDFSPTANGESAGICLLLNNDYHLRLELGCWEGKMLLRLTKRFAGQDIILSQTAFNQNRIWLQVIAREQDFSFQYASEAGRWETLAAQVDGTLLSKEVAGGFTDTLIGMYASSDGHPTNDYADFDWFEYKEIMK